LGLVDEEGSQHFRAMMPPALESVSRVRREIRDVATGWRLPVDVVADAALVVSELATNAVLHARTSFVVVAHPLGHEGIRLEVTDSSGEAVLSPLAPPPAVPGLLEDLDEVDALRETLSDEGTTGRGLSLVEKLSDLWGVSAGPSGKTVWAELRFVSSGSDGAGHIAVAAPPQASSASHRVTLLAVPVWLMVESDRHYDDLLRELQVMALAGEGGDLGAVADEAVLHLGSLRQMGRQATRAAVGRGDRLIDIELLVPPDADVGFRRLETLLHRVAAESRAGHLLTGMPSEEVNAFRRWYRAEAEAQLAGRPPRPCPFPTVRERHPTLTEARGPDVDRQRHERVAVLQATLSGVADPHAAAAAVVAAAVGTLSGLRGALFLLDPDGARVRLAAQLGYSDEIANAWRKFSLRTDVPASECIRTMRVVMLPTPAERDRRYPAVRGLSIGDDPSSVCIPLRTAAGAIGCLALTFRQRRALSNRQLSFLQDMADTAAEWFVEHS
jgi:anti-sigma regulatory factor (Ser/Thr protein kinase)